MTSNRKSLVPSLAVLACLALGLPTFAHADGGPSIPSATQAGIVDPSVGVPETGSESQSQQLATTTVDPSTGILQTSIQFNSPKARGDAQPGVSLSYGSEAGVGYAGWGWTLSVPSIERRTLSGNPNFEPLPTSATTSWVQHDQFFSSGKRLVPICMLSSGRCGTLTQETFPTRFGSASKGAVSTNGWWYFREAEDSSLSRYFLSPDQRSWVVQSKSGVTMEMGAQLAGDSISTTDVPPAFETAANGTVPYRWYVVRKYDAYLTEIAPTNTVYYVWRGGPSNAANGTRLYLSDIYDTPSTSASKQRTFSAASFAHHIVFNYEFPKLQPSPGFLPPIWRAIPLERLSSVYVFSAISGDSVQEREFVRAYHLAYDELRLRSYLISVTVEGQCAGAPTIEGAASTSAGPCPERPATSFTYSADTNALNFSPTTFTGAPPSPSAYGSVYLADMNSDGLPDFVSDTSVSFNSTLLSLDNIGVSYGLTSPFTTVSDAPLLTFLTGNFLADGNVNVGWMNYGSTPNPAATSMSMSRYTPLYSGSAWQWHDAGTITFPINPAFAASYPTNIPYPHLSDACVLDGAGMDNHNEYHGTFVGQEQPYGSADVDGDGYVDLLTFTPYAKCDVGCVKLNPGQTQCIDWAASYPYVQVAIGIRTTQKHADGSLSFFSQALGTVVAPSFVGPVVPAAVKYAQVVGVIPAPDPTSSLRFVPEDLNGDGLVDLVTISSKTVSVLYGHGDGTLALPSVVNIAGVVSVNPDQVYLHDVNGDGLADILMFDNAAGLAVYTNTDGIDFAYSGEIAIPGNNLAKVVAGKIHVMFGDMNGSGVDDVVIVDEETSGNVAYYADLLSGQRPGLLSTVSNGIGAFTHINYKSTTDLDRASRASGATAWQRHVPQVLHHVTAVQTNNQMPGIYNRFRETDYTYTDPVYDPRDQRFVGFLKVRQTDLGSSEDPTVNTETTYLSGICSVDSGGANTGVGCLADTADRPYLSLTGAPVLVETFDASGNYLSSVHTFYSVRQGEQGVDGTSSRFALPATVDTFLYDTASPSGTTSSVTLNDAAIYDSSGKILWSGSTSRTVRSPSVQLERQVTYDSFGNTLTTQDLGQKGVDQDISTTMTWGIVPGDFTGWIWRPQTVTTAPFNAVGPFADQTHAAVMTYNFAGDLQFTTTTLTGTAPLNRFDALGRSTAPAPADASPLNGSVASVSVQYDVFGNVWQSIQPNGVGCTQTTYDPQFSQLPVTSVVYTTASVSPCSGSGLTTSTSYDFGFQLPLMQTGPDGTFTMRTYDGFGRLKTVTKSAADDVTKPASNPAETIAYQDVAGGGEEVTTQTWDGTAPRSVWSWADGFGEPLVTIKDAATSDAPMLYIVSGIHLAGARGHATDTYQPFFSAVSPSSFNFASTPTSASRHTRYDAFGRVTLSKGLNGAQNAETHYHALSTDSYDANNLPSSGHGAYTTTQKDGHGRVTSTTVHARIGTGSALSTIQTAYQYTAAGAVAALSRSSGGATVTQNLAYDSLGRLVENREPNSTTGVKDWRYVYNNLGELVGTSDPRGCGVNIAYDAAGREISEDYSPCETQHVAYTAPQSSGAGLEVIYAYDGTFGTTPAAPDGHLHTILDRAAGTIIEYDPRGRPSEAIRTLAAPGAPADDWHNRYVNTAAWAVGIQYDEADRVVTQSTGSTALVSPATGKSTVTTTYDERGHVAKVTSDYGSLIASTKFDADDLPLQTVYGDRAATAASFDYDTLRRLWHSNVNRPAMWLGATGTFVPPSDDSTLETVLEAKTLTYDAVGNPTKSVDASGSNWPAGAKRMTRTMGYDDLYHVISVTDDTGGDSFKQPWAPEFASGTQSPMPATVVGTRISSQTFNYDWMGNTISSDDDLHTFYDRSLGTITNDPIYPNRMTGAVGATAQDHLSLSYDGQGDVTGLTVARSKLCTSSCNDQRFLYEWDEVGNLSRAERFGKQGTAPAIYVYADISYAYDASGTRVLKTVTEDGQTLTTAEIFPTLRLNNARYTSSGYQDDATTESVYLAAAGNRVAHLVYSTSDPALTATDNQHVLFELKDALHSTSFVIDRETSELVEATAYQAYGAPESDLRSARWGNFREPYRFADKEDEIEVGVTYFGGRYYAPNLGRWMSPDPVAVHTQKGDPNPYAYVSGRVFLAMDPTGLSSMYGDPGDTPPPPIGSGNPNDPSDQFSDLYQANAVVQSSYAYMNELFPGMVNGALGGIPQTFGFGPSSSDPFSQAGYMTGTAVGAVAGMFVTGGASGELAETNALLGAEQASIATAEEGAMASLDSMGASAQAEAENALSASVPDLGITESAGGAGSMLANEPAVAGLAEEANGVTTLSASSIQFSQSSVNGVGEIAQSMAKNGWSGPPLDVVQMGDRLVTVDNTRLLAAHMTSTPVQAVVHGAAEALPESMTSINRFGGNATTWGEAVANRIAGQSAAYRRLFPNGSWAVGVGTP